MKQCRFYKPVKRKARRSFLVFFDRSKCLCAAVPFFIFLQRMLFSWTLKKRKIFSILQCRCFALKLKDLKSTIYSFEESLQFATHSSLAVFKVCGFESRLIRSQFSIQSCKNVNNLLQSWVSTCARKLIDGIISDSQILNLPTNMFTRS